MTAKGLFVLVLALYVIGIAEAFIKAILPAFPIELLYGFEVSILSAIITSKLVNDTREMKYGIAPRADCNGNNGEGRE
jgi:hypothetical protein